MVPSGKRLHSYWTCPFIVDLPIKMVIFHSFLYVYQRASYLSMKQRPVSDLHLNSARDMGMDQYLLIQFLVGWTSINPSYFDVNYRGTRFWHTAISKNINHNINHQSMAHHDMTVAGESHSGHQVAVAGCVECHWAPGEWLSPGWGPRFSGRGWTL